MHLEGVLLLERSLAESLHVLCVLHNRAFLIEQLAQQHGVELDLNQ